MYGECLFLFIKDYCNPTICGLNTLTKPDVDYFDRSVTPRMGWHDVHVVSFHVHILMHSHITLSLSSLSLSSLSLLSLSLSLYRQ